MPAKRVARKFLAALAFVPIGWFSPGFASPAITLVNSFTSATGSIPTASLTPAGSGLYLGTTREGPGLSGVGTVYEFNSVTGSIDRKDSFDISAKGVNPYSALVGPIGGKYYATASAGGTGGYGTIVEYNTTSALISAKHLFNFTEGSNPRSALTSAGGSLYYGTTVDGGSGSCAPFGCGTIFSFDVSSGSFQSVAGFNGNNGANPRSALTAAGGGIYYGTAYQGGTDNVGGVFQFNSNTGAISLKASFNGANGRFPFAALVRDQINTNKYYGTVSDGAFNGVGGVFEFDASSDSITLKDSFDGPNGANPYAGLTAAGPNLYYGVAQSGGNSGDGTVFEFNTATGKITLQDSFTFANGSAPLAELIPAGPGLYYSTASRGGANDLGTIYAFNVSTNAVPGPLPWVGLAATYGWSRRLRRRARQLRHSVSVSS